jgi:hypothetical protein
MVFNSSKTMALAHRMIQTQICVSQMRHQPEDKYLKGLRQAEGRSLKYPPSMAESKQSSEV